ncbi:MAG: sugar ABC transporter substrate-binding protein [Planctomycetota bacterium]
MNRRLLQVALMAGLLASCSPQGDLKSRKVSLIVKSLGDPFYVSLAAGAQAAAAELNLDLVILGIEKETHVERQIALVENEIIKRVGVILISPADSKALIGVLKRAKEKGIALLSVDMPLDETLVKDQGLSIPFIGPDHRAVGRKVGEYLIQRLGGKGKVAVLTGIPGVLSGDLCAQGFVEACKGASGIEIAAQRSANGRRKDAAEAMADILKDHPDLAGVFVLNQDMTLGVLDGLRANGKEKGIAMVGCGRGNEIDDALAAGRLTATIDMRPEDLGRTAIGLARRLLAGESIPSETAAAWDLVEARSPAK